MPELLFFRDLVLAVGAALVGGAIAQRLGQPPLLGYLLGGILIGPYTPGPVSEIRHVATLADIGVVLLIFEIGVEFPVTRLLRVRAVAIGGGLLAMVLIGAIAMGIGRALGFPVVQQVFFGAIASLASTMVTLKMLLDRGEMDTTHGEIAVAITLVEDLGLIAMLVLLPAWAAAGEDVLRPLLLALGKALGLFVSAYFVGGLLLPVLFTAVARLRSRELFLLMVVLVVIGTAVGLAALGLSPALGAYIAGVVVSRSYYSRQVLAELVANRDLFASLFFVSVGMLVDPLLLWRYPGTLLAVIAIITLVRPVVIASIVRAFGYAGPTAFMTGLLLAQIGELSFVLAKLGVDRGFITEDLYGLVLGGALVSILINPLLLRRGAPWLLRWLGPPRAAPRPTEGPSADVSRHADHVVICGCGRVGSELMSQLRARALPFVVIELNPLRIEELRRNGEPCVFGDANNLHVLKDAGVERAKLLAITHYDAASSGLTIKRVLELHPTLKVVARAHYPADVQRLRDAGASEVVMPEFEAGMEFVRWTFGHLGFAAEEIDLMIRQRRTEWRPSDSIG